MGDEHALMGQLADFAAGRTPANVLSMPREGFGSSTLNKKLLRCAIWLLAGKPGAVERCEEAYDAMACAGHCAIGDSPPEPLSPTHAQLYFAAWAATLWGAARAGTRGLRLRRMVEDVIRLDVAACIACLGPDGVRTPGARAYKDGRLMLVNSLRDKVVKGLASGWKKPPRAGKQGSYDVAIPLLTRAFAAGVKPSNLVGDDYSQLTREYGFLVTDVDGDDGTTGYYASFGNLRNALEPVYGVGYWDGKLVVRESREDALALWQDLGGTI